MKKEILKYLKSYSYDVYKINRLIVSAFLYSNDISTVKNTFVSSYIIYKNDADFDDLQSFLKLRKTFKIENLIELFEYVISPAEKIVSGAVYTPIEIREYIIDNTINFSTDNFTICDPACGCAGFLYSVVKKIKSKFKISYKSIYENNIYGVDIQLYSVDRSKLLLSLLAILEGEDEKEFHFNIYQGNSLGFKWNDKINGFEGFDVIIGNPPYVCSRNIDEESKKMLNNWSVCKTGHPDLYIPFFELGLELLKPFGTLGYITMNSFFKSLNGRALRDYFATNRYKFKILDFAGYQIFNSKSTYTCICFIQKANDNCINYSKLNSSNDLINKSFKENKVPYDMLDSYNGWNLNELELLNKIEKVGIPLGKRFKSRNGIATLKNKIYIFDIIKEDENYYYLENNGLYPIEKKICKDIINPNKLIKSSSILKLMKKLIFPYSYIGNEIKLLEENDIKTKFPCAYKYLSDKKEILALRDKGKGKYENWYAYGRNQSLEKLKYKMFFPHITPTIPNYVISKDENLFFHNGLAIIGDSIKELKLLKIIMSSRLFWFYISKSSRLYGASYFSLSKNYFKNFGFYKFTDKDEDYLVNEDNMDNVNTYIEKLYGIDLS
ncbi:SAM-dependent DNA methyltransferase [Marinilabiliaceae bacterium JC017]|nr:SAM-dependent DNA methyltransferase [Marinilabiliaceae bacterium JC017]